MAKKKFVFVNDFNVDSKIASDIKKLTQLVEECPDTTCLIFSVLTLSVDFKKSAKWRNFLKLVQKKGDSLKFENLKSYDLTRFIIKTCEKNSSLISKYNAEKIIEYTGIDMTNLQNECEKLSAFAKGREISIEDIEKLTVKNLDTTAYVLIKAIIINDYARAYSLLDLLITLGEKPVSILAKISDNYVDLYRVRVALQSGKTSRSPAEYGEYRGREFRLTNAQRDIRNLPTETLRKCLNLLVETDLKLKSSKTSGKIILEELIAKLLIINKGGSIA